MSGCYLIYNLYICFSNTFETVRYNMIIHVMVFLVTIGTLFHVLEFGFCAYSKGRIEHSSIDKKMLWISVNLNVKC